MCLKNTPLHYTILINPHWQEPMLTFITVLTQVTSSSLHTVLSFVRHEGSIITIDLSLQCLTHKLNSSKFLVKFSALSEKISSNKSSSYDQFVVHRWQSSHWHPCFKFKFAALLQFPELPCSARSKEKISLLTQKGYAKIVPNIVETINICSFTDAKYDFIVWFLCPNISR